MRSHVTGGRGRPSRPARPRLGAGYATLWSATAAANVGDGIALTAGPLLLASLTDDPALVAGAAFVQQLPWLLFALPAGAYVDRLDRRRLAAGVNLARATALALLAAAVWAGTASIPLVYAAVFVLGTAETVADNAFSALLPSLVPAELLPRANARLAAVYLVANQLGAPALGAFLFAVAAGWPFTVDAACFALAAVLMLGLRHRPAEHQRPAAHRQPSGSPDPSTMDPSTVEDPPAASAGMRAEIVGGLRWLWRCPPLRTLALTAFGMNVTFTAGFAPFVLYARDRLGLTGAAFGLIAAGSGLGGLVGTLVVERLERRFAAATLLRTGLLIETATHLVLAATRSQVLAVATMVVFGVHAAVYGVVAVSLRQRIVPDHLRGRVGAGYFLCGAAGGALGPLLGGGIAHAWGVTAPLWAAGIAMTAVAATTWRPLARQDEVR